MTHKNETPTGGEPGGAPKCRCGGGCKQENSTNFPRENQVRLLPEQWHQLQRLRLTLQAITNRDSTEESGLKAVLYLLKNF